MWEFCPLYSVQGKCQEGVVLPGIRKDSLLLAFDLSVLEEERLGFGDQEECLCLERCITGEVLVEYAGLPGSHAEKTVEA